MTTSRTQTILEDFVTCARAAAVSDTCSADLRDVLRESLLQANAFADAIAAMAEDEVLLFEDETCSIWTCRYDADVVLAPHEHCMPVHIAVYRGTEVEVLYKQEQDRLRHGGNRRVSAGDVTRLGPDAIHAITAEGQGQSHAIHIYEGPLTQVERSLFDWTSGTEIAFTIENFHAMKRKKSDMAEFR